MCRPRLRVHGGFLEDFGQSGVRVDCGDHLVHRELVLDGHDGLRDQVCHVRADHVDAEYLAVARLGHELDEPFGLTDSQPTRAVEKDVHISLAGLTETLYHRGENGWRCTTQLQEGADNLAMREFLASVEGGESFIFDVEGTSGSPDDPRTYRLISWTPQRVDGSKFRYSFELRVQP